MKQNNLVKRGGTDFVQVGCVVINLSDAQPKSSGVMLNGVRNSALVTSNLIESGLCSLNITPKVIHRSPKGEQRTYSFVRSKFMCRNNLERVNQVLHQLLRIFYVEHQVINLVSIKRYGDLLCVPSGRVNYSQNRIKFSFCCDLIGRVNSLKRIFTLLEAQAMREINRGYGSNGLRPARCLFTPQNVSSRLKQQQDAKERRQPNHKQQQNFDQLIQLLHDYLIGKKPILAQEIS